MAARLPAGWPAAEPGPAAITAAVARAVGAVCLAAALQGVPVPGAHLLLRGDLAVAAALEAAAEAQVASADEAASAAVVVGVLAAAVVVGVLAAAVAVGVLAAAVAAAASSEDNCINAEIISCLYDIIVHQKPIAALAARRLA